MPPTESNSAASPYHIGWPGRKGGHLAMVVTTRRCQIMHRCNSDGQCYSKMRATVLPSYTPTQQQPPLRRAECRHSGVLPDRWHQLGGERCINPSNVYTLSEPWWGTGSCPSSADATFAPVTARLMSHVRRSVRAMAATTEHLLVPNKEHHIGNIGRLPNPPLPHAQRMREEPIG